MNIEELEQRLSGLESRNSQKDFMDKYGSKFSGDEGIGLTVLAELQRRGIDTSAADEAVQDILDQLRMEATSILDKINQSQQQMSELMDKVNTIDEAVSKAEGDAAPAGDMPPDAAPAGDMPPDAAPAGNMPPDMTLSDKRAKTIKGLIKQKRQYKKGWAISSGVLDAIQGR